MNEHVDAGSEPAIPYSEMFPSGPQYYTEYYVDGFRSLSSFVVRLEEGLNVLVGPNGSGKTNFIDFLDFISSFLYNGVSTATSSQGGLSRVFSQETLRTKRPKIVAHISGLADLKDHIGTGDRRTLFRFQYDIDIRFSKHHSALYVANESIKFKSSFWSDLAVYVDRTVGTISLKRRSPVDDVQPVWTVGTRLLSGGPRNPMRFGKRGTSSTKASRAELLEPPAIAIDQSFLSAKSSWPAVEAVREALTRGRSFNLVPAEAREPDDLSRPPYIGTDGAGLSTTLYHMQRARRIHSHVPNYFYRRFSKESLDTVISWTTLVLPELTDITTTADPQTGKYLTYLTVSTDGETLRVPLQSASDGTLKWLSFVSLISTQGALYSIEEPENYLHPKMQAFLVDLIRESLNKEHPGYFILSTHSESIINQCKPEELLLFEFCDGTTGARRLEHPHTVREQINKTGFGLGYYYAANAVS